MAENTGEVVEQGPVNGSEGFGVLIGNLVQAYLENQAKASFIRGLIPLGMGLYSVSMVLLGFWLRGG